MSSSLATDSFLSSASTRSDYVQITNPKIIDFYAAHPHISFNDINTKLLDVLEKVASKQVFSTETLASAIFRPETKRKMDELRSFIDKIREAIQSQIQYISSKYVIAKTEYTAEFQAIIVSHTNTRQRVLQLNTVFLDKMRALLFAVIKIRQSNIADKTQTLIRQFEKILNANAESIVAKPDNTTAAKDYIDNFESNASHMMQAITQLLVDCVNTCESRVRNVSELLHQGEEINTAVYYKLIYDLNDILHQIPLLENGAQEISNRNFEFILSNAFPTATILNTEDSADNASFVLSRSEKPTIYIESHEIRDRNVNAGEVKQFITQTGEKSIHGIILSQHTGIAGKTNYRVEIHNNRVIVYLHKMSNSAEKLQIAVDMIDALTSKLTEFFFSSDNKYAIPKDVLDDVNREYQQFILQKEAILTMVKDQHKRLVTQLDEMRFVSLDRYLATRYSSCKKQGFTCDLCGVFNVGTLKGLAAHKRGCARKQVAPASLLVDAICKPPNLELCK